MWIRHPPIHIIIRRLHDQYQYKSRFIRMSNLNNVKQCVVKEYVHIMIPRDTPY